MNFYLNPQTKEERALIHNALHGMGIFFHRQEDMDAGKIEAQYSFADYPTINVQIGDDGDNQVSGNCVKDEHKTLVDVEYELT